MFLEKLKGFPKYKTLFIVTLISSIPFIALTLVFILNELRLMQVAGYGVLDFELAWTSDVINTIFFKWGAVEMQQQTLITYIDYVFIPSYVIFGAECILIVSRKLEGKLREIGVVMTLAFLLAGIFDAVENINLLIMLNNAGSFEAYNPFFASLCASFKISSLGVGMGFLYIASMTLILKKYTNSKRFLYLILISGGIIVIALFFLWDIFISVLIGGIYFVMLFFLIWRQRIYFNEE